jgi:hypothetical protein
LAPEEYSLATAYITAKREENDLKMFKDIALLAQTSAPTGHLGNKLRIPFPPAVMLQSILFASF